MVAPSPLREATNTAEMRPIVAQQLQLVNSATLVNRIEYKPEEGKNISEVFANMPLWFLIRNCFLRILDLSLRAFELCEYITNELEESLSVYGAKDEKQNLRFARFVCDYKQMSCTKVVVRAEKLCLAAFLDDEYHELWHPVK